MMNSREPLKESYISKKEKKSIIKKIFSIFAIIFVLLVLPATINIALSSQDPRTKAQVISDQGATDVRADNYNNTTNTNNKNNITSNDGIGGFFWRIYPFLIGLIIIGWGTVLFYYFGIKFRKKK